MFCFFFWGGGGEGIDQGSVFHFKVGGLQKACSSQQMFYWGRGGEEGRGGGEERGIDQGSVFLFGRRGLWKECSSPVQVCRI